MWRICCLLFLFSSCHQGKHGCYRSRVHRLVECVTFFNITPLKTVSLRQVSKWKRWYVLFCSFNFWDLSLVENYFYRRNWKILCNDYWTFWNKYWRITVSLFGCFTISLGALLKNIFYPVLNVKSKDRLVTLWLRQMCLSPLWWSRIAIYVDWWSLLALTGKSKGDHTKPKDTSMSTRFGFEKLKGFGKNFIMLSHRNVYGSTSVRYIEWFIAQSTKSPKISGRLVSWGFMSFKV